MPPRLRLSRSQILNFRRHVNVLNQRLPAGPDSLRTAAWAGLQDSVPRAALLSLHARVQQTTSDSWQHPSLLQLWGPRFNDYVVAATDLAVFSLGRLPANAARCRRAFDTAGRLHTFLQGQRLPFGQAGRAMGVPPNSLRYAALTGTVLLRWDGARQPVVWTVPPPVTGPAEARLELARRFLHIFGPATAPSFAHWAGITRGEANTAFQQLAPTLISVHTPIGDAWILAGDEPAFNAHPAPPAPARLLPSGDAFYLAWGADRDLLLPDLHRQAELWTSRVWPGALLLDGELTGVWRRSGPVLSIQPWRPLSPRESGQVEAEARSLPLPGLDRPLTIRWSPGPGTA